MLMSSQDDISVLDEFNVSSIKTAISILEKLFSFWLQTNDTYRDQEKSVFLCSS